MAALGIIGITTIGAIAGGVVGFIFDLSEGGDLIFPVYTPIGAVVGGLAGVVIGSVVLT